jgi:hypothetical protein
MLAYHDYDEISKAQLSEEFNIPLQKARALKGSLFKPGVLELLIGSGGYRPQDLLPWLVAKAEKEVPGGKLEVPGGKLEVLQPSSSNLPIEHQEPPGYRKGEFEVIKDSRVPQGTPLQPETPEGNLNYLGKQLGPSGQLMEFFHCARASLSEPNILTCMMSLTWGNLMGNINLWETTA